MKYNTIIFLLIIHLNPLTCFAQVKANDILGIWLTRGKEPAKIQIYASADHYYGKIIWLQNPTSNGSPRIDNNNPDRNRRKQHIIGLVILSGFKFDGNEKWRDGEIYDPESGKTYQCNLSLENASTLKVRGFVGFSLFGRTEVWERTN